MSQLLASSSALCLLVLMAPFSAQAEPPSDDDVRFFERRVRPILVEHCYACHSEQANEQQGGLLLDRQSGWLKGGDTQKAVTPGDPNSSLLIEAVRYTNDNLQMPPDEQLEDEQVRLLESWVARGAPGPKRDLGDTEFSRLGDQDYLFDQADRHWAFQPPAAPPPPKIDDPHWRRSAIDRFVYDALARQGLAPSRPADPRTLLRRLHYDLTGLPPSPDAVEDFAAAVQSDREAAIASVVDELVRSLAFGERLARMWLDVARYADTDSFYRPDTRTPHYFPFAFTYRDYVIDAFKNDKPFDQFVREQLAADLMGYGEDAAEMAALGFLTVGPHANRNQAEALDDWIDVTTRGLMGMTVACARCHDHKFEPIPTKDYYALRGVFASIVRVDPLNEKALPILKRYRPSAEARKDYEQKRAAIDAKIEEAGGKKARNNNRSIVQKMRETELAELLLFHPGGPAHTMIVRERSKPPASFVFLRGDPRNRGEEVPRRFLQVVDGEQDPFPSDDSGRLELANRIVHPQNPLTARVFVNRVWGMLMGAHLVETPSDFGLQGAMPSHPQLLDWLAADFMANGWSTRRLARSIVLSKTYQQRSAHREQAGAIDPENHFLWRANRKHLSIEGIRDSMLAVSGEIDRTPYGRPGLLWGDDFTRRRSIYGYVNRFNLDPTLRVFDFPSPMQSRGNRGESIVAPQALFVMNSPFVIEQAATILSRARFREAKTDGERAAALFEIVLQREAAPPEVAQFVRFIEQQSRFFPTVRKNHRVESPWVLAAQSLLMCNEFQYID